jgi:uncharacterized protein YcaQ
MIARHGLSSEKRYSGKEGVLSFIRNMGCIQFDPIDVCGKNHEILLLSRIQDFKKNMVYDLLYQDRRLLDGWDKNMAIYSTQDWKYFARMRISERNQQRSKLEIEDIREEVLNKISVEGPVSSKNLQYNYKVDWGWVPTNLSRAVLEKLYYEGELIVHHKSNTRKYYDLASKCLSEAILLEVDPNISIEDYHAWHVLRRISSVGLLWEKASDAFLGIHNFKAIDRKRTFKRLLDEGKIIEVHVSDIKEPLFMAFENREYLDEKLFQPRLEFIAPLDNLMWDRKLIETIFGFRYRWEIYTPIHKRQYGYYVLPMIFGDAFVGRVEFRRDEHTKKSFLKNIWWEDGFSRKSIPDGVFDDTVDRFMAFMDE